MNGARAAEGRSEPVRGWQLCATPAGAVDGPDALARAAVTWTDSADATTVAAALRAAGIWKLDAPPRRFDAEDWWWRARVPGGGDAMLCLDGLATVADVWLDGARALHSENMFVRHELPVPEAGADLLIRCHALDALLATRRPRPRWRAPMIEHQQLRWFRTTVLGRTPGWSPPAAPVGPWRGVRIRRGPAAPEVSVWLEGTSGVVERGGETVRLPKVALWWPHTHGEPVLHTVRFADAEVRVGFRTIELDRSGGGFGLRVNGVPIFCRGAVWNPLDPVSLDATRERYAAAMTQARDAGMNMLRVAGTTVYERDAFLDLADELGILVWQDLMFANMDYPDDPSVESEVRQELARWQGRPSLAVVCGNSEVEQQAAMWGAGREHWSPRLFHETLPAIVRDAAPGIPYWPSSAHGGAFPHVADVGTTSYYGVGAYLRPLDDARRSQLRFATECLAFANLPRGAAPDDSRTPRDLGATWDFGDVRDHYVGWLFRVDPAHLRETDPERYLALGRVATGEVMAAAFGEWRRARSPCRGALVLSLRDLWPCAGWGLIDATGAPKAAYHYCRRALAPLAVHLSDEGGNGLAIHVTNDRAARIAGELALELWRDGEVSVGRAVRALAVDAHAAVEIPAAELLDGFTDLSYAYRFGPPPCDLVIARFVGAEAFHFPAGLPAAREDDLGFTAELRGDELVLNTRRFAQSVSVDLEGFAAEDDFFHLGPGASRAVRLRPLLGAVATRPLRGAVHPLNAHAPAVLRPA